MRRRRGRRDERTSCDKHGNDCHSQITESSNSCNSYMQSNSEFLQGLTLEFAPPPHDFVLLIASAMILRIVRGVGSRAEDLQKFGDSGPWVKSSFRAKGLGF